MCHAKMEISLISLVCNQIPAVKLSSMDLHHCGTGICKCSESFNAIYSRFTYADNQAAIILLAVEIHAKGEIFAYRKSWSFLNYIVESIKISQASTQMMSGLIRKPAHCSSASLPFLGYGSLPAGSQDLFCPEYKWPIRTVYLQCLHKQWPPSSNRVNINGQT